MFDVLAPSFHSLSLSLSVLHAELTCAYLDRSGHSRFLNSSSLRTYDPLSLVQ
jgi:hypothetical protein